MPTDDDWKPRWNPAIRVEQLPLAAEEGFVLSRLDGHTRVADLPSLTRLTPEQVNRVLQKLEGLGAVLPAVKATPTAPAPTDGSTRPNCTGWRRTRGWRWRVRPASPG